jgi:D-3-phosphoglycerate dehydrogenase
MTNTVEVLVLDLLEWLLRRDRSYEETMEAWRTSCPRLPIWEDASDLGFVRVENALGGRALVRVTPAGAEFLRSRRSG